MTDADIRDDAVIRGLQAAWAALDAARDGRPASARTLLDAARRHYAATEGTWTAEDTDELARTITAAQDILGDAA